MNEQDLIASGINALSANFMTMIIPSLVSFLVVYFVKSESTIKRLPFFGIAAFLSIITMGSNSLFEQAAISNIISTLLGAIIAAISAWFIVMRVRDADYEKEIAYFSCIPFIGNVIIIYLFFAESKPQQEIVYYPK